MIIFRLDWTGADSLWHRTTYAEVCYNFVYSVLSGVPFSFHSCFIFVAALLHCVYYFCFCVFFSPFVLICLPCSEHKEEISSSCSANAWEPNAKLTFHLIKNDNNTNNNSNSHNNKIKWSSFKWNVSWRRDIVQATLHQTIMFTISQHRWDSYAHNAIWCCDYCKPNTEKKRFYVSNSGLKH